MPETPRLRSPLEPLDLPGRARADAASADAWLEERPFAGKLILRGNPDDDAFAKAAGDTLGSALPGSGRAAVADAATVLWQGPDHWLLVTEHGARAALQERLGRALADTHAAITDVSSASTVIRLGGPRARDVLCKGCFLDFEPPHFTVGSCAPTRIAVFAVTVHQVDDTPAYDLYVARGMALAFCEWLLDGGLEYGIAVANSDSGPISKGD